MSFQRALVTGGAGFIGSHRSAKWWTEPTSYFTWQRT